MKNSNGWLKSQYEKNKRNGQWSIQEVLDTNAYINGPQVQQFQKSLEEYLDVKHDLAQTEQMLYKLRWWDWI
jgi:dTDP-4-amino-4,6-dideoxygalactose transaminase